MKLPQLANFKAMLVEINIIQCLAQDDVEGPEEPLEVYIV